MPEMSQRSDVRAGRRTAPPPAKRVVSRSTAAPDDRFFRHIVSSMRNGVIAIRRDGSIALMNDEAYRIFALTRGKKTTRLLNGLRTAGKTPKDNWFLSIRDCGRFRNRAPIAT